MQGCGNDYIYFDCFSQNIENPQNLSVKLSNRHYGIVGDGIILICPSSIADAKMKMFNADGSEGKMCGNGIRCVGKYLADNNIVNGDEITIETLSGIKSLKINRKDDEVQSLRVDMGSPIFSPAAIPVNLNSERILNLPLQVAGKIYKITCISMGNPHCVVFVDSIDILNLDEIGQNFENHEIFSNKTNTEFVKINNTLPQTLTMRVWERGSGETLACGTGACAAVVAAVESGYFKKGTDITAKLRGGDLIVNYTDETVYMTGDAKKVFEGVVQI
jgi:carbamoyl-phosphate synthase large subunit